MIRTLLPQAFCNDRLLQCGSASGNVSSHHSAQLKLLDASERIEYRNEKGEAAVRSQHGEQGEGW
jgi:hypothetical protein